MKDKEAEVPQGHWGGLRSRGKTSVALRLGIQWKEMKPELQAWNLEAKVRNLHGNLHGKPLEGVTAQGSETA